MQKPARTSSTTVISIVPNESLIKFSSMEEGESATFSLETKECQFRLFDEEFFKTFLKLINEYSLQHPDVQTTGVTLVLPDRAIATDVVNIPTLRRKKTDSSLEVAVNDLYKNSSELKVNRAVMLQNKQYTTYGLSLIKNSLLESFNSAFAECKMVPQAVTFSANASVNALQALNPKLKNATYMLMDIKENFTRISFVAKGRTCGYYSLPFGYSILENSTLAAEDMLFDHSQAELLVLNAKEKAKAKQLTMMANDTSQQVAESMLDDEGNPDANKPVNTDSDIDENFDDFEEDNQAEQDVFTAGAVSQETSAVTIKTLPKKQPRKLPKFMLRPPVSTPEEYAYENFRIFEKWALNLIQMNKKRFWSEKPDAVYVNMPGEYDYLFDVINEEKKENGITFAPLGVTGAGENILQNLETYGGFFTNQFNTTNNF